MKKYVIAGLALFIVAFCVFSTLTITWETASNKFRVRSELHHAFALELADCVCCHASTTDRHHRLSANDAFPCTQCHQILYDPIEQMYTPALNRDCTVCHTVNTVLLDRHHVTAIQASCFTCHQVLLDPVTQSYYITLLEQCTTVTPPPTGDTGSVSHYAKHKVPVNDCTSCHLCNLFDQHGERCDLCHTSVNPAVQAAIQTKNTQCSGCHPSSLQHSMKCDICHTGRVYDPAQRSATHYLHTVDVSCGICHEIPETTILEPTGQYCNLCHSASPKKYNQSTLPRIHRKHVQGREYFPYSCYMCHGQSVPQTQPKQCIPCHDNKTFNRDDLTNIHYLHNRRFDCSNCHYDPRLFGAGRLVLCERCHEMRPYASSFVLHAQHMGRQCWSCHASENVSAKAGTTCASCHGGQPAYTTSTDIHRFHDGKAYPCWICHNQLTPMYIKTCDPLNCPDKVTIAGTVTSAAGAPLAGAEVFTNPGGFLAVTASDGTYSLLVGSDVTYTITALKTGYERTTTTITVLPNSTVTQNFMLPVSSPGTISGTVTNAIGTGLGGVTVTTDIGGYKTTTASNGTYQLSVTPATYTVTASKSLYVNNSTVAEVSPGQTVTTNLVLNTTTIKGKIIGKVTDRSGLVVLTGAAISTDIGGYTTTTSASGAYALAVDPGTYVVTARKPGYATNSETATVYSDKIVTANIWMIDLPSGTISGKVSDSGGLAISGAIVSLSNGSNVTTTAADGTYSFSVVEGTYTVVASKGGYNAGSTTVTVTSTLTATANITLTASTTTGTISGKVTDQGGVALSGATVSTNAGGYATATASDGTYSLTVLTGTYTITASKSGYYSSSTTATVTANQALTVNIALSPIPGTISGKVTDSGGVAISGATVSTNTGGYTATTAADGTYSLSVIPGTYTLTASKTGFTSSSATVTIAVAATVIQNLTLSPTGTITGKVTDSGGTAISGATVSTDTGGYTTATATDGTYSLTNVNAGTYTVTASNSGYNSGSATVAVAAGATVTQNFALTSANLALKKSASASGYQSGYPASYAVDGDQSTRWWKKSSTTQWIKVDLGAAYSISKVILRWNSYYARDYQVLVSTNNVNWTTVKSIVGDNGGVDEITFTAASARYVQIKCTKPYSTTYGYSLYEFEVYQ